MKPIPKYSLVQNTQDYILYTFIYCVKVAYYQKICYNRAVIMKKKGNFLL